ncbi:hypothetical protein PGIGA_G00000450 [Pangasianodon gigas]|uniref:Uncharacterized protein n=1 Tax=Pangasianodon gigas TaxID=30993 RepID=A0ACC5W4L5_PANGG|nr:hypothetical protein [Pangasianodon gigas]
MKYILVTGGVISGIGKGIIASSVGTILKSCGLHVTAIKIDPYINIDAGTFSPYEHGEVFVLDDGGEVDLDLGNYERFLDIRLTKDNNLTTGKIYQSVITKERRGDYLGKTVQVVPHITDAIQEWVMRQAKVSVDDDGVEPQVCVIELGGTVGDIESMPFIEAFRQFQFKVKRENFCNIHVSLVPQIVCRCSTPLDTAVKEKISMFCHVEPEQVICIHDVSSVYRVPLLMEDQGMVEFFCRRLNLPIETKPRRMLTKWKEMSDRTDRLLESTTIALVGKYTKFSDSYASIVCRCSTPLDTAVKEKISMFCHVEPEQVICIHDVSSVYRVPLLMEDQGMVEFFCRRLNLPIETKPRRMLTKWKEMSDRTDRLLESTTIALVGKYTKFSDSYASVIKALEHSALAINYKLELKFIDSAYLEQSTEQEEPVKYHEAWQKLCSADGILIPGGFGVRGIEGKIHAINWARKQKKPFLGVCLGMQLAVVEFARNVLGWKDANSTEFDPDTKYPVVIEMPEHNPGQMGGTMRLGKRRTIFKSSSSILRKLYGDAEYVDERHRHRFEVNPALKHHLEEKGFRFMGQDQEGERMEIIEIEGW